MKRALFLFTLAFVLCATVTVICVKFLVYVDGKKNSSPTVSYGQALKNNIREI